MNTINNDSIDGQEVLVRMFVIAREAPNREASVLDAINATADQKQQAMTILDEIRHGTFPNSKN
jgi:hypothetical protein